ncbi:MULTISPECIES: transcription antitermination factor NusB [Peptoniphilus]|jgi:transcription antitermination factor nusB|uniref:transcription antitermination factor NusB n=1 Tax=Peptoniphilus TaxID=162289 RepID=UPI00028924C6|nr:MULTISPECIES: transcription antitermination factor NusB [Peptoniphilus]MBS6610130.1 transcription antitermination factor NusB [Peptoniphilus harei]MDU1043380.1 transcription antitermination factor NusB [Peptoniphilus rhinitidis]MDU1954096.1 transcription antitermination factor NusB [Peptoniphilus lacydonensis]MDU2109563.1 transcription antitermination factor NusB [Peptoniphilus lacydonensis]MDU3750263.1 transcription antitermination factor NusB [Peptoniphilus rhinitidis]
MSRKKARIGAMQALFSMDINDDFSIESLNLFMENNLFLGDEVDYINRVVPDILDKMDVVDSTIEKNLKGWTIQRLAKVDRQILRIAVYEFLYKDDIPPEVSINEAVEIARIYGSDDSPKFINGILGSIYRSF